MASCARRWRAWCEDGGSERQQSGRNEPTDSLTLKGDLRHIRRGHRLPDCLIMRKRAIAAFLLVAMTAWAEMALAPMLAMHAGHMLPGHEMAGDMPALPGGHHHHGNSKMDPGRPCCPRIRAPEPAVIIAMSAGAAACNDPHSCCFRQGPQSVPAPASNVEKLVREVAPALALQVTPVRPVARFVLRDSSLAFSPPPDIFGMVLRV
jgi:hypothetical protein